MENKNTAKEAKKTRKSFSFIKLIRDTFFLVGVIIFVISIVTVYKTYTDSEIIKADVVSVSGTKNGKLDVEYRYNYGDKKYEESVRQSVDEIKVGDKKEIVIQKSIPEKITTTTMKTAICSIIAFTLCFIPAFGLLIIFVWLDEERREERF